MSTATVPNIARAPFSVPNKAGLVLAGLLGVVGLASLAKPTPPGQLGPPLGILVFDALLGVVIVVAVVAALRTCSRGCVRLAAGASILSMVTALPAFFAGVSTLLVVLAAAVVLLNVTAVVLMLLPTRSPGHTGP